MWTTVYKFVQTKALTEFFSYLFIYFWSHWFFAAVCRLSPVAVQEPVFAVASLVAEHRLCAHGFQQLQHVVSVVVTHRC